MKLLSSQSRVNLFTSRIRSRKAVSKSNQSDCLGLGYNGKVFVLFTFLHLLTNQIRHTEQTRGLLPYEEDWIDIKFYEETLSYSLVVSDETE